MSHPARYGHRSSLLIGNHEMLRSVHVHMDGMPGINSISSAWSDLGVV